MKCSWQWHSYTCRLSVQRNSPEIISALPLHRELVSGLFLSWLLVPASGPVEIGLMVSIQNFCSAPVRSPDEVVKRDYRVPPVCQEDHHHDMGEPTSRRLTKHMDWFDWWKLFDTYRDSRNEESTATQSSQSLLGAQNTD